MKALELLIRGIIAGLIIAAPVGPVNVICVQRTIAKGWRSGLISGLGSAAADSIYGSIAAFSITFVIRILVKEEFWIRLVGGCLLILIGVLYYFKHPQSLEEHGNESEKKEFVSTFFLTLTNPTTVLSFLVVLSAVGLARNETWWLTSLIVGGIFVGSMLWWVILTGTVNYFRDRFSNRTMLWMNRIAGLAIGAFGLLTILTSRSHHTG
jgi:threonine/homoserine/homoserine lactone efflux protein